MTKNELATIINHKANIIRTLSTNYQLDFIEGNNYDNWGNAESWQDESASSSFTAENDCEYEYVLYCKNVPCHKVDYSINEECEVLDAENCESEGEVLVPANAIMEITYVSADEDAEEMGYYTVELEFKGFRN